MEIKMKKNQQQLIVLLSNTLQHIRIGENSRANVHHTDFYIKITGSHVTSSCLCASSLLLAPKQRGGCPMKAWIQRTGRGQLHITLPGTDRAAAATVQNCRGKSVHLLTLLPAQWQSFLLKNSHTCNAVSVHQQRCQNSVAANYTRKKKPCTSYTMKLLAIG